MLTLHPLTDEHLATWQLPVSQTQAYLSPGSVAYCLCNDGVPVFAGGIVNMLWQRGEAWILPTPWFKQNWRTCYRYMVNVLPTLALVGQFRRVQAVCNVLTSPALFHHLGFEYEGLLKGFGPNGETCRMYSKIYKGQS